MNRIISVIVPVYNVETYLEQCVESIRNQTFQNLEIILVDDGSTDLSGEICDTYLSVDNRIKVIHKTNGGLSDARNVGIQEASGDFIAMIDSDDWIDPVMLEKMVLEMNTCDADIVMCGYSKVYKNMNIDIKPNNNILDSQEALRKLVENIEIQDHACTSLYKKSLWDHVAFPVGVLYEDIRTIYKIILKCNRVRVIGDPFYKYRQRNGSITRTTFNSNKMESLTATEELKNVPEIASDEFCMSALKDRLIRVKGYILIDLFMKNNEQYDIKKEFFNVFHDNVFHILFSKRYPKSLKYIALLSPFGIETVQKSFSKGFMSKYYKNKYHYFD